MLPDNLGQTPTGRLVLIGGAHSVSSMFSGQNPPNKTSILAFHDNIKQRSALCRERGIGYRHYVMPDPLVFASSEMETPDLWSSYFEQYFDDGSDDVFYPFDALNGHLERQTLTDSHYSPLGNAKIVADIAAGMLKIDTKSTLEDVYATAVDTTYNGGLALKCTPVPSEQILKPNDIDGLQHAHNGLEKGNTGIINLTVSPRAATDRVLLIFGDSFFRSMLSEFGRYWGRIVFCRTRHLHQRIIDAVQPDDVLTGMAERYLSRVTPDSEAPDVLAMPLMAGRKTNPSKYFGEFFTKMVNAQRLNDSVAGTIAAPSWPSKKSGPVEARLAFVLWLHREGRATGLKGPELSAAWAEVRDEWLVESNDVLTQMHRMGLRVGMEPK